MTDPRTSIIALRPATPADDRVLHDLAGLDSARPVEAPVVLGIVDDRPVAAISLQDGRVVADPFARTVDVVALLKHRAAALRATAQRQ